MLRKNPNVKNLLLFFIKSSYIFLGIFILAAITSFFILNSFSNFSNNLVNRKEFTAKGEAKQKIKPDMVSISLTTTVIGEDVREVQKKSSDANNKAIDDIKKLGVEENELHTSNYSITPIYTNPYNFKELYKNEIKEYTSIITLTVQTNKLDKISEIINASTNAGINQISSLHFYNSNLDQLKEELKLAAIDDAKSKASITAEKSSLKLGKLLNVQENNVYYPSYLSTSMKEGVASDSKMQAEEIVTNIQSGENEISQTVILVYEIL